MNGPVTFEELATLMKGRAGLAVDPQEMASRPDTHFDVFGLDSLGLLGIVSELENRYGRQISNEPESCKTPQEFLDIVNSQLTVGA
ncbi:acyl carrier protein [Streptomyces sp. H10-C2]|uniref:acyl carrier protein n=1 Tax=unclassified Streptomyces TaxID=2593676 RepID=UPI0024BA5F53|nr:MULTISPECIES: acyl carrier protein [unclassified Streptomyces]MDJ0345171.1 acyl carrier protein [Streptomyces sp. PH10-H1]MDJ0374139.1 acyl carrier protein [Streptomyces sp. H10-C2]